jgi:hypothetical protein
LSPDAPIAFGGATVKVFVISERFEQPVGFFGSGGDCKVSWKCYNDGGIFELKKRKNSGIKLEYRLFLTLLTLGLLLESTITDDREVLEGRK